MSGEARGIEDRQGVLAIIPARGGSKGLPRKNVLPVCGLPLIAWTVRAALGASCIVRTVVSTDDDEIADVARQAGAEVPFRRPAELATDTATSADVVAHVLESLCWQGPAVLLQPTTPLRTAGDIDAAHTLWRNSGAPSCVSVCEVVESPWLMFSIDGSGVLQRLLQEPLGGLRRQDLPRAFILNGVLYFVEGARFLQDRQFLHPETVGYTMPACRSVDIDTAADMAEAERLMAGSGANLPELGHDTPAPETGK